MGMDGKILTHLGNQVVVIFKIKVEGVPSHQRMVPLPQNVEK